MCKNGAQMNSSNLLHGVSVASGCCCDLSKLEGITRSACTKLQYCNSSMNAGFHAILQQELLPACAYGIDYYSNQHQNLQCSNMCTISSPLKLSLHPRSLRLSTIQTYMRP